MKMKINGKMNITKDLIHFLIVLNTSAIVKAINKALENLNEPAQNKVLDYINDLKENNKNLRNFVENLPKNKKR